MLGKVRGMFFVLILEKLLFYFQNHMITTAFIGVPLLLTHVSKDSAKLKKSSNLESTNLELLGCFFYTRLDISVSA